MIPIIIGPQGPGYINAYIDENNNLIEITTPPNSTGIPIGKINCYTGATGPTGSQGIANPSVGPDATDAPMGATGKNLESIQYNPVDCTLRCFYNDGVQDLGPLMCQQDIVSPTGPSGPSGPNLEYVTLIVNCDTPSEGAIIQNIYSDGQIINGGMCCVCPGVMGPVGPMGVVSNYGATGPAGAAGVISQYGATGPTGVDGTTLDSLQVVARFGSLHGMVGRPGAFVLNMFASIDLASPIQFSINSDDSIQRKYMSTKQRAEVLFPNTPLNTSLQYNVYNVDLFTELADGILCNVKAMIRIRMSWKSNDVFMRPFAVLNYTSDAFPSIITAGYSNITQADDMYCIVNAGDVLNILPGTYIKYPVPLYQTLVFSLDDIHFSVTAVYLY